MKRRNTESVLWGGKQLFCEGKNVGKKEKRGGGARRNSGWGWSQRFWKNRVLQKL